MAGLFDHEAISKDGSSPGSAPSFTPPLLRADNSPGKRQTVDAAHHCMEPEARSILDIVLTAALHFLEALGMSYF